MLVPWHETVNAIDVIMKTEAFSAWRFLLRRGKVELGACDGFERLVCSLEGTLELTLPGPNLTFELGPRDICRIPPTGNAIEAQAERCFAICLQGASNVLAEVGVKRFSDSKAELRGEVGSRRIVYTSIGEADVGWMLAGFTEGYKGEWTSYPPHKHDDKLEVYVYYGPERSLGIQVIETEEMIEAYVVRPRDAVFIDRGYHPNVAAPESGINYLWALYPVGPRTMKVTYK